MHWGWYGLGSWGQVTGTVINRGRGWGQGPACVPGQLANDN
jgi:hypothetical protein